MSGRWPLGSEVKHSALGGGAMLYDASRVSNFAPTWFDPTYWKSRGELDGTARGRGTTYYFKTANKNLVLRHYRRGGLVRHVSADKYFWLSAIMMLAFGIGFEFPVLLIALQLVGILIATVPASSSSSVLLPRNVLM